MPVLRRRCEGWRSDSQLSRQRGWILLRRMRFQVQGDVRNGQGKLDGKGEVVVQQLSPGEYALARGRFIYTSTEDLPDLSRVRIFPNPSHGEVWINWPDVKITPVQYRWLNSMGQVVGQGPLAEDLLTGSVFQIPDHQLSSGQYFLQLFASDGRSVSRTIILH